MKAVLLVGLSLIMMSYSIAHADPTKADQAVFRLVYDELREKTGLPSDRRKQLANAILDFWKDFNMRLPRNSPTISEWLNNELNTTDTSRIGRATSTTEYALRELGTLTDDCISDAELAQKSVGKSALVEMYAWLRVAGCYGNPLGTEHYLKLAKLSQGLYEGPVTMAHAVVLHNFITGRVGNAILSQAQ
ncbi:hypothetical protein [Rhizobium oryzicola]|uniref:Transglycosylase SLT domain-containing protein n=1 Tax=Rhizobium oryzicola TaxID=1232668 RepID=A0ABT8SR40_9HYPH|nr:hypothetical protein [Rhizobium oryzicola]MDO1580902.1 hypothetical protein [Rhizobium oryzicola]